MQYLWMFLVSHGSSLTYIVTPIRLSQSLNSNFVIALCIAILAAHTVAGCQLLLFQLDHVYKIFQCSLIIYCNQRLRMYQGMVNIVTVADSFLSASSCG